MRRRTITGALAVLSILLMTGSIQGVEEETGFGDFNEKDPIRILGNEGLNETNGVSSGNGTEDSPYIIQDLFINSTEGAGIEIIETDAHIWIHHNVVIHAFNRDDPTNVTASGIRLVNCSNVSVERVYVYYFNKGLEVVSSDNISVHDSSFSQNNDAVVLEADDSSITGCFCSYNTRFGVFINNSRRIFLKDILTDANSFTMGAGAGIQTVNCSNISISDCYGTLNYGAGISIIGSYDGNTRGRDLIIKDCYVDSCVQGIQVLHMDNVLVESTRIRGNTYGVQMALVSDAVLHFLELYKNYHGMNLFGVRNSTILESRFERNDIGSLLDGTSGLRISSCSFWNSTDLAVEIKETDPNIPVGYTLFTGNRFVDNGEDDEQVRDLSGKVSWSHNGIGNYWSDWQISDEDEDGIVDLERDIKVGSSDPFPLFEEREDEEDNIQGLDNRVLDRRNEDLSFEYWMIVGLSILATLVIILIVIFGNGKKGPSSKESF